jgi:hypothetical protein
VDIEAACAKQSANAYYCYQRFEVRNLAEQQDIPEGFDQVCQWIEVEIDSVSFRHLFYLVKNTREKDKSTKEKWNNIFKIRKERNNCRSNKADAQEQYK